MDTLKEYRSEAAVWVAGAPEANLRAEQTNLGRAHAARRYQRDLQQARDAFKRADRDLNETVAFVVGSLTTVTAIEAVINIAVEKLKLQDQFPLKQAFEIYILVFLLIFTWGFVRGMLALQRRAKAEQDLDLAKKGIFDFCPPEQWPTGEE